MRIRVALLLFLAAIPARAAEPTFDVLDYDVRLAPDFAMQEVSGTQTVRFQSLVEGLSSISFSANSLDVVASIDGEAMVASEVAGERRVFHLARPMRRGQIGRLVVSFKGKAPKGLVFRDAQVYATYFTCDTMICDADRPGDKATLTFQLTLPPGMEAVAPGRRVAPAVQTRGAQIWRWRERRARSAYLYGFAAGRFQRVTLAGERPDLAVLAAGGESETIARMFADTRRMMAFFEAKAGVKFGEPGYTQVLVDGSEAQEAAGHSTIGMDEVSPILGDPHEDWAIAHELAHQWWGNSLTCADWSELWLNEGLSVFMVAAYKEERWGRADYDRELALANKRWAAAKAQGFDVPLSWKGAYPSLKHKRAMAYAKSVVFLDALRHELGELAFWRGIRIYTRTHWEGVVSARDFSRAMERASGRDLSALFRSWVFGEA